MIRPKNDDCIKCGVSEGAIGIAFFTQILCRICSVIAELNKKSQHVLAFLF